jgi:tRNA(adenine34) deaminase
MSINHEHFMRQAIELGKKVPAKPFGALLVHKVTKEIFGEGWNQSTEKENPTSHGEMEAIIDCVEKHKSEKDYWSNLILYTTAEPCAMCQGAALWSGIRMVVFGSSIPYLKTLPLFADAIDIRAQAISDCWTIQDEPCEIISGILEQECNELFELAVEISQGT